ncbi:hypothetical protein BASA81_000781 [Batrachochytrium salamandrivorans]|nr:hypothetical protein BASA81_000781 [Batrachochytrium salamandrivorans]
MESDHVSPFKRGRCDSFASLEETHRLLDYDLDMDETSTYYPPSSVPAATAAASTTARSEAPSIPPPSSALLLSRRGPRTPSLLPRRNISALDYLIKAKNQPGLTTPAAQLEWKKLTRTEKHVFETLAKEDLERYQRELVGLAKRALNASTEALAGIGPYSDDDGDRSSAANLLDDV